MLKKFVSKALLTVALDKKARAKVTGASGGIGAFFTIDNFSYNDIETALNSN